MSLETWKAEFYPVPADMEMTEREAIVHSLRKWTGLLKKNLKDHDLKVDEMGDIYYESDLGRDWFTIDGDNCALCQTFYKKDSHCYNCPLYKTLGRKCHEGLLSPYYIWITKQDVRPMIRALRLTLKKYDAGELD